jgi:glycosyltransferase involved in cell wall biosynthesis
MKTDEIFSFQEDDSEIYKDTLNTSSLAVLVPIYNCAKYVPQLVQSFDANIQYIANFGTDVLLHIYFFFRIDNSLNSPIGKSDYETLVSTLDNYPNVKKRCIVRCNENNINVGLTRDKLMEDTFPFAEYEKKHRRTVFLVFIDGDDILHPQYLHTMLLAALKTNADIINGFGCVVGFKEEDFHPENLKDDNLPFIPLSNIFLYPLVFPEKLSPWQEEAIEYPQHFIKFDALFSSLPEDEKSKRKIISFKKEEYSVQQLQELLQEMSLYTPIQYTYTFTGSTIEDTKNCSYTKRYYTIEKLREYRPFCANAQFGNDVVMTGFTKCLLCQQKSIVFLFLHKEGNKQFLSPGKVAEQPALYYYRLHDDSHRFALTNFKGVFTLEVATDENFKRFNAWYTQASQDEILRKKAMFSDNKAASWEDFLERIAENKDNP